MGHFEFDHVEIFQAILKPHILSWSNGQAIWHGLPDMRHIKVNHGR